MENKKLTIGLFVAVALIISGAYFISETDKNSLYFCEIDDVVGICFKLSAINDNGLQTRCYYNSSAPLKHKRCSSGWIKWEYTDEIIDEGLDEAVEIFGNGELYACEGSKLYSRCISPSKKTAYYGEL